MIKSVLYLCYVEWKKGGGGGRENCKPILAL